MLEWQRYQTSTHSPLVPRSSFLISPPAAAVIYGQEVVHHQSKRVATMNRDTVTLTASAHGGRNRRRRGSHGQDSSYFLGWEEYERNPYHPVANPTGIIQMGLAENQLSFDLLESWLTTNPGAARLQLNDGVSVFRQLALFQDYHGLPAFKRALARFMGELRGGRVHFDPNKLVLTAGATSANEILMFCLAQPGDAFLLPTPYYPGFDRDLKWRTGVELIPIHCTSANGFRVTKPALERAYRLARKRGARVKGVVITNPSNPLGTTMTRQELSLLLNFVADKDAHLISDEIYSGTVFGSDPHGFVSVMDAVSEAVRADPASSDLASRVHVVYSLSKDLGLPGFRVGTIYSNDPAVVATATKMSSFSLISSQTQFLLSQMLADEGFTRQYTTENHRRIKSRHDVLVLGLKAAGIPCLPGNAGLFCWADMRGLLAGRGDFAAEMELWEETLYGVGINISPGSSCHCSEPGWFRICFANMDEETLTLAIQRITAFVLERRGPHQLQAFRNKQLLAKSTLLQITLSDEKNQRLIAS